MNDEFRIIKNAITVILGAGASYDLVPGNQSGQVVNDNDFRPPLTPSLFKMSRNLEKYLTYYPKAYTAIGTLRNLLHKGDKSLETLLKDLKESNEVIKIQEFRQIPFYLQHLFLMISQNYCFHPVNYTTLISETLRKSVDAIAYVTLNYDLFIEKALESIVGFDFSNIESYVPHDQKWMFIKLHGSANWGRKLKKIYNPGEKLEAILDNIGQMNPDNDLSDRIEVIPNLPAFSLSGLKAYFPSITVPVDNKYEFNCQKEHLIKLESLLRISKKILIIGISGKDQDLLDLLSKNLTNIKLVTIVGGGKANEIKERLKAGVPQFNSGTVAWKIYNEGFSEFIKSGGIDAFLDFE